MDDIDVKDMIVKDALDVMEKLDEAVSSPAEKIQPTLLRHRKVGRPTGYRCSAYTKQQISLSKTGYIMPEETKRKISEKVKRIHNEFVSLDRIEAVDFDTATTFKTKRGYINVYIPYLDGVGTGNYMRLHTALMEKTLGRKLKTDEDVHHVDGNKENNNINNLQIMSRKKHLGEHPSGRCSKNYIITFPNGNVKKINNLYRFCVDNDLLYVAMCNIANNKKYYRSHHGFSCVKAGDE